MRLQDISNYKDDLPGALKQASAEVPVLEAAFKDAELKLAQAETERQRWQQNFGRLNSSIPLLEEKYRAAKRRVMTLEAESGGKGDTASGWTNYRRFKAEHQEAVATLAFLSNFPQPDADRAYKVAEIEERIAYAAFLEGRAARARCSVLVATMGAQQYDPGVQLDASESWSNAESQKAAEIMTRVVPILRDQLSAHDRQVELNQAAMSNSIWN